MRHAHLSDRAPTYHSVRDHEHFHLVCRNVPDRCVSVRPSRSRSRLRRRPRRRRVRRRRRPPDGVRRRARTATPTDLLQDIFRKSTFDDMPDSRRLRDPRALTALAHPVRMGIIELLAISGPLTATRAGRPARRDAGQLLVAPAQARRARVRRGGRGRHRPPAAVAGGPGIGCGEDDDATLEEQRAGRGASSAMMERWRSTGYLARRVVRDETAAWRDAQRLPQYDRLAHRRGAAGDERRVVERCSGAYERPPSATAVSGRPGRGCASSSRGAPPVEVTR